MKILHLITTLERGGAETQLLELVTQQIARGNQVSVAYLKGQGELSLDFNTLGAEVICELSNHNPILQFERLRALTRKRNPFQIVHCHLPRAELLGYFICLGSSLKLIVTRHNTESFWPSRPGIISRWMSRKIIKKSRFVICISNAVRKHLFEFRELRAVDSKKAVVVYYGFRSRVNSLEFETRDRVNTPPINLVTVSRLTPQKDLNTMLKGFNIYSKKNISSQLTIVGQGYLKDQIIDTIAQMGLTSRVRLVDKVADVPRFLSNFDVFLLSSRYEGFGLVLLEAMQARIPIISSNSAAAKEVLGEDYPGLFNIGIPEELAELLEGLENEAEAYSLPRIAAKRLLLFDPSSMGSKIELLYQEALNS